LDIDSFEEKDNGTLINALH